MKNNYTCFIAGILAITAAHGQPLLLGGFDGTNALNAPKQSAGLAGLTVVLATDAPETNFAGQMMSTLWGAADLDPDAFTSGTIEDLAVVRGTSALAGWTFTMTITNNTGSDVNLEKIHYRTKKDANDGPDLQVVSYTSGSLADATGKNTGPFAIGIGSDNPCDVDLSGFLTDLTLAGNGETAVFTWSYGPPVNQGGNTGLRLDNIAISGSIGSSGSKSAAPTPKPKTDSAGAQSKTWDNDPNGIKVFILAGQSNMVGYGKTEDGGNPDWVEGGAAPKEIKGGLGCLRYLAMHDDKYPEFAYRSLLADPGKPETSAWKTRRDVKVWWRNGHYGKLGGEIRKGDLGPPFQGGNGSWFGPEYAFGQIIGDHYKNDDVLIIKTAWGGHALATNFRPPSAVEKRGGVVGESFTEIFRQTQECLDKLGEEFPEWKGKGYQIVGFAWHQGFNDRVTKDQAAEYKDNLPDLIADVRKGFGKPELPFVIASTGMAADGGVEEPPYEGYSPVERAQLWVAGVDKPGNVLSSDTRPFWIDPKDSPSTAGHHWNHSAQSYFLIGKTLADDMLKLISR